MCDNKKGLFDIRTLVSPYSPAGNHVGKYSATDKLADNNAFLQSSLLPSRYDWC